MLFRLMTCAFLGLLAAASPARAHPHVFVDVGLRFETDAEGALTGVEVTWVYDDLFTLLVLSDHGLDPDADMILTEAERAQLIGFDLADWPEGFEGALFIEGALGKMALGPPEPLSAGIEEDRLVTRHRRSFGPVAPDELMVRAYDPSYYAALTLSRGVILPERCAGRVETPDRTAADALVESLGGAGSEAVFEEVAVGIHYADKLVIACER